MPRVSSKSRNSGSASDRRSRSQAELDPSPATSQQTPNECDAKTRALVNYILLQSSSKAPIKFSDLLPIAGGNQKELSTCMEQVNTLLEERYGIKTSIIKTGGKKLLCYAETNVISLHELTADQRPLCTLLYILLAFIFMRDNKVDEEKLYRMLESLHIDRYEPHAYFGDVRKHIEETLCKQLYLKREREPPSAFQDPKVFYSWGARAQLEYTFDQIAQCTAKLFNEPPTYFDFQVKQARGLVIRAEAQRRDSDSDSAEEIDPKFSRDITNEE